MYGNEEVDKSLPTKYKIYKSERICSPPLI